jgi:hypothetical protein
MLPGGSGWGLGVNRAECFNDPPFRRVLIVMLDKG